MQLPRSNAPQLTDLPNFCLCGSFLHTLFMPYTAHSYKTQLDVPECAFFGLSGSLVLEMGVPRRHSHSLQGGNNEAGRVEKGAIGCVARSPVR